MSKMMAIKISDLRHELQFCSAEDVITDGELKLKRTEKLTRWAKIELKKKQQWGDDGHAIRTDRDKMTHQIFVRHSEDVQIRSAAWLFEDRGGSPDRWFKVLRVDDFQDAKRTQWLCMECRHVESADDIVRPVEDTPETNQGLLAPVAIPEGVSF